MHCYICVTYLMIIATAHPPKHREVSKSFEKRSIFNDVIQSLRIRSQLPEDLNLNDENNIGQNDDRYEYDNEPLQLPSDIEFMPRRNDRIEMPTLKYRFPKSLMINSSDENIDSPKKEVVIYINTPTEYNDLKTTTLKPKKQKRPTLTANKNKVAIKNTGESESETDVETSDKPFVNTMAGQSQIGNRESQTVVKPTVIVNFRGTVTHRESDIKLEKRKSKNETLIPHNIFNIKQEINLERHDDRLEDIQKVPSKVKQNVKIVSNNDKAGIEEDMMMCETASWKEKEGNDHTDRKRDVLQILVSI
ncbi:uncharacterized protein [Maniola hyperantus]|uniref:uncharacterized protein n=1 Tax=Aphantopus hyperantus TaxID=2795564 RepID=UPI0015691CD3|nr:uncharacterized protein LOC117982608 [Maniola hyperantus]